MTIRSRSICMAIVGFFIAGLVVAQEAQKTPVSAEQAQEAIRSQLPPPPEEFVWLVYKNAVLPRPAQWNGREKSMSSGGIPITVYAASPEDFSDAKQFETGMTIQIISGSQKVRGIEAKKMALLYLKPFLDAHKKEEVLMIEQSTKGDFERTIFRYLDAPPGLKPVIVHKFILANNVTDSVHVVTFESPADSWQDNWTKYGTPILSKVSVYPNVSPR